MPTPSDGAKTGTALGGALLGAGGTATAAAAAVCCTGPAIGPLVVGVLGAGGAAALAGLRPFSLPLLVLSGIVIGFSLWRATRKIASCAPGSRRLGLKVSQTILWIAFAMWIVSTGIVTYTFFLA